MQSMTREELIERIFNGDYETLKGQTLRMTRVRVPGKEVCLAHVITPTDNAVYHNLGLDIGVHEGENHMGEAIGLVRFTPWESVVVAADVAMKAADIEIGFMDRFCGSLIITGKIAQVETAILEVLRFFKEELGFATCDMVKKS